MVDSLRDDVVDRLRNGDPHVLGELFQEHQQRLLHIIRVRMDQRMAARVDEDDVLQEVYLDAAARIQHYIEHPDGSFFVWAATGHDADHGKPLSASSHDSAA